MSKVKTTSITTIQRSAEGPWSGSTSSSTKLDRNYTRITSGGDFLAEEVDHRH